MLVGFISMAFVGLLSGQGTRPPWEWSADARIKERLDPQEIAARIRAHSALTAPQPRSARAASAELENAIAAGQFMIDGRRNPELFMPTELFDRLLAAVPLDPTRGEAAQRTFREAIIAFGWDPGVFWAEVGRQGKMYTAARERRVALQMQTPHGAEGMDGEAQAESNRLGREMCMARMQALNGIRQRFGPIPFDRFLYTVVAPRLTVTSNTPTDAATLRWIERGCP